MKDEYRAYLIEGERAGARYELAAPQRPPMGMAGSQLGRMAGSSLEFKDHRNYQAGDDLRHIDWSAYARSDRLIVKLFREEVSPHLDLLLDGSRSMDLPGAPKARAALGLAAALCAAAANAGFSHRAWLTAAGCVETPQGASLPSTWRAVDLEATVSPEEALTRLPPRWRPQAVRVFISDLLWLGDPMRFLSRFASGASAVTVIQVLAQEDAEPGYRGNLRLADRETGEEREMLCDVMSLRRYRDALARHQQSWSDACRATGAAMVTLIAEKLAGDWDFSALVAAGAMRIP